MSDVVETRIRLVKAIGVATGRGYELARGVLRESLDGKCNPLGAVLMAEAIRPGSADGDSAARILGITSRQAMSISAGFDGIPPAGGDEPDWYQLGVDLAVDFLAGARIESALPSAPPLPVSPGTAIVRNLRNTDIGPVWEAWQKAHPWRTSGPLLEALINRLVALEERVNVLESGR